MSVEAQILKARTEAILHSDYDASKRSAVDKYQLSRSLTVPTFKTYTIPEFTPRTRPQYKPRFTYFTTSHPNWTYKFNRYLYDDTWYDRFSQRKTFQYCRSFRPQKHYNRYQRYSFYYDYSLSPYTSYMLSSYY
ncbi:hypothetical protein Ddc_02719 [Ditylenchus destructor]|nr:hypothetical protein Ddc_02719 [Ditylenchus destructor]